MPMNLIRNLCFGITRLNSLPYVIENTELMVPNDFTKYGVAHKNGQDFVVFFNRY